MTALTCPTQIRTEDFISLIDWFRTTRKHLPALSRLPLPSPERYGNNTFEYIHRLRLLLQAHESVVFMLKVTLSTHVILCLARHLRRPHLLAVGDARRSRSLSKPTPTPRTGWPSSRR